MIRPASASDFGAIAAITNHYIATSAIHFGYDPVSADELAAHWREDAERYPWLVAVEGDAVVGYAKSGAWRTRAAYRWTCEVTVYVARERQRAGIGRALYVDLLARLAAAGFHSAIAGITLPNAASVALHVALGFEAVGVVRDAGWKHERWHDVAFYQRLLVGAFAGK